jgi:hypothetical protein
MATRTQPQISWARWSRDFAERLETHLAEVKDQGRAETPALWTPSSWTVGFSTPWLTKTTACAARQAPPYRLDFQSPCLLLSPSRAVLPQTPTPQTCKISARQALKDCQAGDPQTWFPMATPSGLHKHAQYPLCEPAPLSPAKSGMNTRMISAPPGRAPQACAGLHDLCSARPQPQGLPSQLSTHLYHLRCALRPAQASMILQCLAPHASTGLHDVRWECAPKACQAGNTQARRISTLLLAPWSMPCLLSEGQLFCLN